MFPAWAGMNRGHRGRCPDITSVPRVGGDEPAFMNPRSPAWNVFPAWAGMNRQIKTGSYNLESVPRVGGDEPHTSTRKSRGGSCSPRGRG